MAESHHLPFLQINMTFQWEVYTIYTTDSQILNIFTRFFPRHFMHLLLKDWIKLMQSNLKSDFVYEVVFFRLLEDTTVHLYTPEN